MTGRERNQGTCLSCGVYGPVMARQLCTPCYKRAWAQGLHTQYPTCGAVPVPCGNNGYIGHDKHPTMPPATFDLSTLTPSGAHTYAPQTTDWQRTESYNQRRAAEWLAQREQGVAA